MSTHGHGSDQAFVDANLTLRWMLIVETAMRGTRATDFDSFIDAHPELLRRDLLSSTR